MNSAFPRVSYVGRVKQKDILQHWSQIIANETRCRALYFQADGGLGKTWLLNSYPFIVQSVAPKIGITGIIDFYNFENRNPNVIERKLIDSLKRKDDQVDPWYCLPAHLVTTAFKEYMDFYAEYIRSREQDGLAQNEYAAQQLRDTFVACWNRLAATYPLVMRFDTIETLYNPPVPPEALVNAAGGSTGAGLVLDWITTVLPRLQATLALFSGRPLRDRSDHPFIEQLKRHNLLAEPVQELTSFIDPPEIREYLQRYTGIELSDAQIAYSLNITHGHPLLLTCYAETLRSEIGIPPGLPLQDVLRNRKEFENWLVATILNPLGYSDPQQTLLYCLHFLSYARRGIRKAELHQLFNYAGLEDHRYDVVDTIGDVALVKVVQDQNLGTAAEAESSPGSDDELLFLHDEIHLLIDQSGFESELGLREFTLQYLAGMNRQRVRQLKQHGERMRNPAALLKTMSDQLYYELAYDIVTGYRTYTINVNWLLNERNVNETLILSDVLWSTLVHRVQRQEQITEPYYDALRTATLLTYEEILADEQINQIALFIGQGRNKEAAEYAEQIYVQFTQSGVLPTDDQDILNPHTIPEDHPFSLQYCYANFNIRRAHALLLAQGKTAASKIETIFSRVIAFLETPDLIRANGREELLAVRRNYFLGRAYTLRGYLRRQQQRFAEAQSDYEQGRSAFKRYREQRVVYRGVEGTAEELLNDYVPGELAQVTNNLGYNLALAGNLKRALRLSNEVIQEFAPISASYLQARFYNTNALIRLLAGDYRGAEVPILLAEQAAQDSGNSRVLGLVAQARGFFEHTRMFQEGKPQPDIAAHYRTAVRYLKNEPNTLYEIYLDWARFERDLSKLYRAQGQVDLACEYEQHALQLLTTALDTLPKEPSMQHADVLENRIAIYITMERYDEAAQLLTQAESMMSVRMPAYGQILSGKLALQHSYLSWYHQHNPQASLRSFAIALARVYVFAREHRDQQTFERLAKEHLLEMPLSELKVFQQQTEREDLYVISDELPYQRPNAVQWSNAWEDSIAYISGIIADRLAASA